jgi:hypothetical protein
MTKKQLVHLLVSSCFASIPINLMNFHSMWPPLSWTVRIIFASQGIGAAILLLRRNYIRT